MSRFRDDSGFTLVELMLVSVLFVIILGATLQTFTVFEGTNKRTNLFNEQINSARTAMDTVTRQMRNLARPENDPTTFFTRPSIRRATAYDFLFQTSDPSKTWLRYCLATSGSFGGRTASANNAILYQVVSASRDPSSAMLSATSCPGTDTTDNNVVSAISEITNRASGKDRPVFSFTCSTGAKTCDVSQIDAVRADLYLDTDLTRIPAEEHVSSSVYLRNQNEPPTANGIATYIPPSDLYPNGQIVLNGSGSDDPEGRTLEYYWFRGSIPTDFSCERPPSPSTDLSNPTVLTRLTATFPAFKGINTFNLAVCDPGYLGATFGPIEIRV